jgi:signal transduction histidine kinase/Tfp pilus assembly protein PilF
MTNTLFFQLIILLLFCTTINIYAQSSNDWKLLAWKETETLSFDQVRALYEDDKMVDDKALLYAQIALSKAEKTQNNKQRFRAYRDIGAAYEDLNKMDIALETYHKEEFLAEKQLNDSAKITSYIDLAVIYLKISQYQKCKDYYTKVIASTPNRPDNFYLECAYHGLGALYSTVGDYQTAVDYYLQSSGAAEVRKDTQNMALSLQFVANCMLSARNTDQALATIERTYQMGKNLPDKKFIGLVLNDYGHVLMRQGKFDAALEKYQTALVSFGTKEERPYVVKILMNIAEAYNQKGEHGKAHPYLLQCLNEYRPFIMNEDLGNLYLKLGNHYNDTGNTTEALENYKKGLEICEKLELRETYVATARVLAELEEKKGNLIAVIPLLKKAQAIEDSLFNEKKAKSVAELQMKFDTARTEKQVEELKARQNKLISIALGIILLLSTLSFAVWSRMKAKANKVLLAKNQEIDLKNRRLEERNLALREFAYVSAHDIKEPLRNIGSFASLLQRRYGQELDENANDYINFINGGVLKMNNVLGDLLDYSTLVVEKDAVTNESISMEEVIESIKDTLKFSLNETETKLINKRPLPSLRMSSLHQTQLFQSLILNAMKFNDQKPVIHFDYTENQQTITLSIEDNGIGIDPQYSHKVYQLFQRLDKVKYQDGNGIGLTICKNIVEKYDGKLWFEPNKNGIGTTFFMTLPK